MTNWVRINAIAASVISGGTLISAGYLLWSLARQGRGKLRVRLLLGMVTSDLLLGFFILPQELSWLAGRGPITGHTHCNVLGFFSTAILFSQHVWSLCIAVATYLLLKHPLSSATTLMEKWSFLCGPVVWSLSLLHSGIWWRYVGWMATPNFCFYGSHPIGDRGLDARDLVQFIPRLVVFTVVVGLYTRLYSFLRRPDTITLSSQFVSGTISEHNHRPGHRVLRPLMKMRNSDSLAKVPQVNPDAPWEAMEFIQVGGRKNAFSPTQSVQPHFEGEHIPLPSSSLPTPGDEIYNPFDRRGTGSTKTHFSDTDSVVTSELRYNIPASRRPTLAPVVSDDKLESESTLDLDVDETSPDRHAGQTLSEFFTDNAPVHAARAPETGPQISATAYFNRQASLLMLYFPLAYLVVFSMSLVRLVYAMAVKRPSPVLSLMSAWMVLGVGLIDGLIYGLAEWLVRKRVRRKLPEQFNEAP